MIGNLVRWRPGVRPRRTLLTYRLVRRVRRVPPIDNAAAEPRPPADAGHTETMLFDGRPAELPVATVRARTWTGSIAVAIRAAVVARWRWIRPRLVPLTVAAAGAGGLLVAAEYLTKMARETPEQPAWSQRRPVLEVFDDTRPTPTEHAGESCPHRTR